MVSALPFNMTTINCLRKLVATCSVHSLQFTACCIWLQGKASGDWSNLERDLLDGSSPAFGHPQTISDDSSEAVPQSPTTNLTSQPDQSIISTSSLNALETSAIRTQLQVQYPSIMAPDPQAEFVPPEVYGYQPYPSVFESALEAKDQAENRSTELPKQLQVSHQIWSPAACFWDPIFILFPLPH